MQVVYHLGAPCTDKDQLIKSLLKNRARLTKQGVVVPPPGRYRTVVRDAARALKGMPASEDIQDALLDAIMDEEDCQRLVLSNQRFICINRLVVRGAQIWPMIERETTKLRNLFPQAQVEFFIAMRDPATLIPALFKGSRFSDFEEFSEGMQPGAVTWSEMLFRLSRAHPDCHITVWNNEDTPLIWGELLQKLADVPSQMGLKGVDDLLEQIIDPAGFTRMQAYLAKHPPRTESQRRRIAAAFLDKFALEDEIEEELDVPGWTEQLVTEMTELYEADMDQITGLPNVTYIAP
ncbi:hypothetical protein E2K80_04315 [Rhodophyticola sp. CCM32]|uniref:hypothetical protein n=1 Tax=Rhodophyticola sp. CCM32 TaxID=2916397 RepID=UPI00107FA137|nr:hypothetical protein [Rhodophyticola sp. CCM32]QBY00059.1 hypothetical protein E2K80_04315 [Rhodophyticola sp. CCM32]